MRLLTFLFALMLVMGVSFGGVSYISSQPVMAQESGGEAEEAAGDMEADDGEAAKDTAEDTAEGEIPGGEMEDEAQK